MDVSWFIGQRLVQLKKFSYSTWMLQLSNCTITVYNPLRIFRVEDGKKVGCRMDEFSNREIVDAIYLDGNFFKLELSDDFILEISLLEDDYDGPEAMLIDHYKGSIVVI